MTDEFELATLLLIYAFIVGMIAERHIRDLADLVDEAEERMDDCAMKRIVEKAKRF